MNEWRVGVNSVVSLVNRTEPGLRRSNTLSFQTKTQTGERMERGKDCGLAVAAK